MEIGSLIRSNILTLKPYHSARESVQEGILLDANENPHPQESGGILLNRYPDPFQRRLRSALSAYIGVSADNVVAGVGSDEVLDWIFKVFCQPGQDQVAAASPSYGMYRVMADVYGIPFFEFELDENFDFDIERFLQTVPRNTKVLFLCSPNNPTGNLLSQDRILELCRTWPKIVVLDEAYIEFADAPSLTGRVTDIPNLIVMRTLSKAFAGAALRLGYAVASTEIISHFLRVKAPYNLSALTMEQGCRLLGQPQVFFSQIQAIQKERRRVAKCLQGLPGIEHVFASRANFLLFRCPDAAEIYRELFKRGIVVRDRSRLPRLSNCLRVSVGTQAENDLFLKELKAILEGIS